MGLAPHGHGDTDTGRAASSSLGGEALVQSQQLPHQRLSKLGPAVALGGVGVGHLVEDVGVVDGDADAQPEDLLPRLVGFMEDEVPAAAEPAASLGRRPLSTTSPPASTHLLYLSSYLQM